MSRRLQLAIKRTIDIFGSLVLVPFALVLCLVAVVVVQLYYPGWPIGFMQKRIGRYCRVIVVPKLRTLPLAHVAINNGGLILPRPIRLIRRFGVDELPQLALVLVGDMSLIGNRPLIPAEWQVRFGKNAWAVQMMRPGILSTYGFYAHDHENSSDLNPLPFVYDQVAVDMSLGYVNNWSLAKDIKVVVVCIHFLAKSIMGRSRRGRCGR